MFNLEKVRHDTSGVARVTHLNNCGAALPIDAVVDAVIQHLKAEREMGPYEAAAVAGETATRLYGAAASLIGCDPQEIAFCDSATRAWNTILYSLPLKRGDLIFVSPIEFGSSLIAVQHVAERSEARVEVLPADEHGRLLVDEASRVILSRPPALIAITHAAAHSGAVNDVNEIGRVAKDAGAFYLVDACQSLGQMPVSVEELHCDALTATARKWLRGPRGTGFLYVRSSAAKVIDPATADLVTTDYFSRPNVSTGSHLNIRQDARKFELWERSIAGAIGFGIALQYLLELTKDDDTAYSRIRDLAKYTAERLREIPDVDVWAPQEAQSGVIGFIVKGAEPKTVKTACAASGINISTMADYDAPLDFERRSRSAVCRVAPHYYNTNAEIDTFIEAIAGVR